MLTLGEPVDGATWLARMDARPWMALAEIAQGCHPRMRPKDGAAGGHPCPLTLTAGDPEAREHRGPLGARTPASLRWIPFACSLTSPQSDISKKKLESEITSLVLRVAHDGACTSSKVRFTPFIVWWPCLRNHRRFSSSVFASNSFLLAGSAFARFKKHRHAAWQDLCCRCIGFFPRCVEFSKFTVSPQLKQVSSACNPALDATLAAGLEGTFDIS